MTDTYDPNGPRPRHEYVPTIAGFNSPSAPLVHGGDRGSQEWMLAQHIEGDHEREMPGYWSFSDLSATHAEMHKQRDDWGHTHGHACRNCGAPIYVESFSDGSTEWQHDYPQDDWDGRICNVDRDDNTWAEPERLTDTEIVKRIVDILNDPENSEECVDQVQMICFLLDSQGYPTPD